MAACFPVYGSFVYASQVRFTCGGYAPMDTETNSKLIVIVEDHPETAALIAECVSEEPGYETVIAGDAGSGLEMIHARRPDLVLLDAWLPDVNGFQLYDTLHEES